MDIAKEIVSDYLGDKKVSELEFRLLLSSVDTEDGCIDWDLYKAYKDGSGEERSTPCNEVY